jgi:N-acetylmuramoyl-L-alanine amidase
MPSVLVELGFLTNKNEGRYLNSQKGQWQMGKSIADAIKDYIANLKLNTIVKEVVDKNTSDPVKIAVEFKVQIASGKNKIAVKSYNFRGLKNIERVKIGRYYKYYYKVTSSYKDIQRCLSVAKEKGYSSAFVVAFKNGKKVSVKEVNKMP